MLPRRLVKLMFHFFRSGLHTRLSGSWLQAVSSIAGKYREMPGSPYSKPPVGSLLHLPQLPSIYRNEYNPISRLFKKQSIAFLWRSMKKADFQEAAPNDFKKRQVFLRQCRTWKSVAVIYLPGYHFLQRTPGNYGKSFRMRQQLFQGNILLVAGLFQLLIKVYDICID